MRLRVAVHLDLFLQSGEDHFVVVKLGVFALGIFLELQHSLHWHDAVIGDGPGIDNIRDN